ncbi:hypothetical protein EMIT053CA3_40025 [Pseudomonas donghuensis]
MRTFSSACTGKAKARDNNHRDVRMSGTFVSGCRQHACRVTLLKWQVN